MRLGSGAGMGQKPDDWRTVPLCRDCHATQHTGEMTFWTAYCAKSGQTVDDLIHALCITSPKAREIEAIKRERRP